LRESREATGQDAILRFDDDDDPAVPAGGCDGDCGYAFCVVDGLMGVVLNGGYTCEDEEEEEEGGEIIKLADDDGSVEGDVSVIVVNVVRVMIWVGVDSAGAWWVMVEVRKVVM